MDEKLAAKNATATAAARASSRTGHGGCAWLWQCHVTNVLQPNVGSPLRSVTLLMCCGRLLHARCARPRQLCARATLQVRQSLHEVLSAYIYDVICMGAYLAHAGVCVS